MDVILEDIKAIRTAGHSNLICTMKPARFKAFIRVVRDLVKLHGPHPIRFENGRMAQPIGQANFIVDLDMSNILGSDEGKQDVTPPEAKGFSGNFIACDTHLRELSSLIGAERVEVSDSDGVILFSNGHGVRDAQILATCPAPDSPDSEGRNPVGRGGQGP